MGTAEEIEQALLRLSASELNTFREWFVEFDAVVWDRQIENDGAGRRLDQFAEEALKELDAGDCKEI